MIRLLKAILVAATVACATLPGAMPLRAQVPVVQERAREPSAAEVEELMKARNSIAMFYYGSRYALHVLGGVVVGGYLFALLSWGRTGPTIMGSVIGSTIGIWWFLNDFAADVLRRHEW